MRASCRCADGVLGGLRRIRKRLGGLRHAKVEALFKQGLDALERRDDPSPFIPAIRLLLIEYYDPMYEYQLGRRGSPVLFRGAEEDVVEWTARQTESTQ